MTVIVRTPDELEAALNAWFDSIAKPAIRAAQLEVIRTAADWIVESKATWSAQQPNPYWSGQFRASVTIAAGLPDETAAPDNPGPWPIHPNPYPPADIDSQIGQVADVALFQTVFIADASPNASEVESHVGPFEMTTAKTLAAFAPGYSWRFLADQSMAAIPF